MSLLRNIASGLRSLFRKEHVDRELDEELRTYLEMEAAAKMKQGMNHEDAVRAVRLERGNLELTKEVVRSAGWESFVEACWQDLRYAMRSLRKSPVLATVVVLSLALGIGANTAIFSLIDAVMLRFLPVQTPQELVAVQMQRQGRPANDTFTNALWEAVRDQQDVFSGMLAWMGPQQFDLAQGGGVRYVKGLFVSGGYFTTLGIRPVAGRLTSNADDHRGCAPLAVLSYGFWQSDFAGAESAIGNTVSLRGHPFEVIGVTPPRFYGAEVGKDFDIAIPLCASEPFDKRNLDSRVRWWLFVMGRMKPGMTLGQVRARLAVLSPPVLRAGMPEGDASWQKRFLETKLIPIPAASGTSDLRDSFKAPLAILMAIVALVLLIACANITSLMLAKNTARSKEISIRKALGASRSRVIRQLVTESVLLSLLGAGAGMLFAEWGGGLLVRNLSTGRNPVFLDLALNNRVLGFTLAIAVLTGIVMGLLPAMDSNRVALIEAITTRTAGGDQRSRFKTGRWIVAGQVALSLVLLVGAGLLLRTFMKLLTVDLGFDRNQVLIVSAKPPWWAADDAKIPKERRAIVDDEIASRLRTVPGVISVSRSLTQPLGDDNWADEIQPDTAGATAREPSYFNFVTPEYFATLRTPLVAGRNFDQDDTRNSQPVAIVNETLARRFFAGMNPIGRQFRTYTRDEKPEPWIQIVGIVKDSKYQKIREEIKPTVFLPASQAPPGADTEDFEVRTAVAPAALISAMQSAVAEVSPQTPLAFHTLAEQVDDNLVQERLMATLAGFFGVVALVLAMIGLYGVLAYAVTQRQIEFGIRMALGAEPGSILRLVMRDVVVVLSAGLAIGMAISLVSVRILQKLLFGLEPRDPLTIMTAVCVLTVVALFAGYLPARRATRVDPMVALRHE
jgi:putative ABC transport system permease protein